MVEQVFFYYCTFRSTEERASCTVVADGVVGKIDFGRPGQVLYPVRGFGSHGRRELFLECNDEFPGPCYLWLVVRAYFGNGIDFFFHIHGFGPDEFHTVAGKAPIESPGLVVHVASAYGMVVYPFQNLQVGTVHVDGIVHHVFIQTVDGRDFSLAL